MPLNTAFQPVFLFKRGNASGGLLFLARLVLASLCPSPRRKRQVSFIALLGLSKMQTLALVCILVLYGKRSAGNIIPPCAAERYEAFRQAATGACAPVFTTDLPAMPLAASAHGGTPPVPAAPAHRQSRPRFSRTGDKAPPCIAPRGRPAAALRSDS